MAPNSEELLNVSAKMNSSLNHDKCDQNKEMLVVLFSNAVIEPNTMMIEFKRAPIASSAMFGELLYMSITKLTIQLVFIFLKVLIGNPTIPFFLYDGIAWV